MAEKKKVVVLVIGGDPTIYGGLEIMSKGLKDWRRRVNGSINHKVKITPPLSKREKEKFPFAY